MEPASCLPYSQEPLHLFVLSKIILVYVLITYLKYILTLYSYLYLSL